MLFAESLLSDPLVCLKILAVKSFAARCYPQRFYRLPPGIVCRGRPLRLGLKMARRWRLLERFSLASSGEDGCCKGMMDSACAGCFAAAFLPISRSAFGLAAGSAAGLTAVVSAGIRTDPCSVISSGSLCLGSVIDAFKSFSDAAFNADRSDSSETLLFEALLIFID